MEEFELDGIKIYSFPWDVIDSKTYMITDGENAILFDAVYCSEMDAFMKKNGIKNVNVFLTHEHFDHIYGIPYLRENYKCRIYSNDSCAEAVKNPSKNLSNKADIFLMFHPDNTLLKDVKAISASVDCVLEDGQTVSCCGHSIETVILPGHSSGSSCFVMDGKYLFSGDTLLGIPTVTRFPTGSKKLFIKKTIPFLKSKAGEIEMVFPGHGEPGNISDMIKCNEV